MPSRTLASHGWYFTTLTACEIQPVEDSPTSGAEYRRAHPELTAPTPRTQALQQRSDEHPCRRIRGGSVPETHSTTGDVRARLERLSPGWAQPSHLTRRRWAALPRVSLGWDITMEETPGTASPGHTLTHQPLTGLLGIPMVGF